MVSCAGLGVRSASAVRRGLPRSVKGLSASAVLAGRGALAYLVRTAICVCVVGVLVVGSYRTEIPVGAPEISRRPATQPDGL